MSGLVRVEWGLNATGGRGVADMLLGRELLFAHGVSTAIAVAIDDCKD